MNCSGEDALIKNNRGSLEILIFEAVRILSCSDEYDPVFRVALEVEDHLIAYSSTHLLSLLRISQNQVKEPFRSEAKDIIMAIAQSRPDMDQIYDVNKSYSRLTSIFENSKFTNLRALALFLRAKVVRDRDLNLADQLLKQFFTEFNSGIAAYSGAICSMFRGNLLVDLDKTEQAVTVYHDALHRYKSAEMKPNIPMAPYLLHGYAAALNANGSQQKSLMYIKRLIEKFPDYEGIPTAQMELDYLQKSEYKVEE